MIMNSRIQKLICLLSAIAALLLFSCSAVFAQHGGKAEPLRIEFKRGTTSTTLSGSVRGDEEMEYVLAAKEGQTLIIKATSVPVKSSVFDLHRQGDDLAYATDFNYSGVSYSGVLPKTGDYFINVKRLSEAKGASRY